MGPRRYGISLWVFNLIAHEWAQQTSEMSSWTQEEKFHIYKQPCIICLSYKHNSPLLRRKADFINEWK